MKLVTCGLCALFAASCGYVFAQDLGALAAKERERRKEQAKAHPTPARVVTDDDMSSAAQRRAIDSGEKAGTTPSPAPQVTPDPSVALDAANTKLRETLEEDRQERLAARFRRELRVADDEVQAAEAALQAAKDRHDKVPMLTDGEQPFAARHRAEASVTSAERQLQRAKDRVRAIEDEAQQAGLDPSRLH